MSEYLLEKAKTCYHCKPLVDENEILSRKLTALEAENERLREVLKKICRLPSMDAYLSADVAAKALRTSDKSNTSQEG